MSPIKLPMLTFRTIGLSIVLAAAVSAQDPDGKARQLQPQDPSTAPASSAPASSIGSIANMNMTVVRNWNRTTGLQYNDVWGYTAPNGQEFALVGETKGIWIVETTDPKNIKQTAWYSSPTSTWRDFTNLGQYVYSVSEHHRGIRIIDMGSPSQPKDLGYVETSAIRNSHNVRADPATGYLYVCGTNQGLAIYDCATRTAPKLVATWKTSYTHDACIRRGRAYLSNGSSYVARIMNASNPANMVQIGSCPTPGGYDHNVWVSEDDKLLCVTDELSRGTSSPHMTVWDISNPASPAKKGDYDLNGIVHNVFIIGRTAYMSHYSDGVHVVDLGDPTKPTRVASWDTSTSTSGFNGCWGVFPFTDHGLVYASDMQTGLFVFQIDCGHLNRYGAGTPGKGGLVPRMRFDGATPRVAGAALRLEIENLQPNARAVLVLSETSGQSKVLGVDVHVGLQRYWLVNFQANANGQASLAAPVPDSAGLANVKLYAQIVAEDAGGPAGFSASRGMWAGICPK